MNDEAPRPPSDDPTTPPSSSDSASASPSAEPTTEPIPPTGPYFAREHLVRPRQGRYVAGVCAALARATNTDPVLWRVLLAVLGILSGVGVLLYLIGWLIIPAEGDTASPIESLLGKGRSGMAPLSVILLGAAAAISFAFIVNDGMRAGLLAAAVILGAVILIKRSNGSGRPAAFPAATPPPPGFAAATATTGQPAAAYAPAGFPPPAPTAAPAAEPVTDSDLPPRPPFAPPPSGYRPPFAPHGPWAGSAPTVYPPPQPMRPPKPPKPPRERSKLGRLTFFAVIVVIGAMAAIDMAGASIAVSAYFAAALITIALGLIVGAWFGRARGLIALAILTSIGLGIANGAERWGGEVGNSTYRPQTLAAVADRYDFTAGNATLDLRDVDFNGQTQSVTATMKVGQLRVLLPAAVDTTASVKVDGGRALVFGREFSGDRNDTSHEVTDLGNDGAGGGTLKLDLQMDTGNVEVLR
ncbi:PspC domain-containing protein [Paractinoplanes durhamensis]|uniref:PspC family transcriptional regulator n=1 Tax=Paractinoplanes durhamensis TaxID=113563 RepID=A0ABQ3Z2E0_9ACTN|nr:PspC domain-containing protein [Actinoplanes durhamensis]GIE03993.1 PspC family transcriptional regulator [Actinoplanes durhamensis]